MHPVIRDVAAALDKAKVIKIDVDKKQRISWCTKIKGVPTLMMYRTDKWFGDNPGIRWNSIISIVQRQFNKTISLVPHVYSAVGL
jgi:thioredoxin 1